MLLVLVLHLSFQSSQDLCDLVLAFLHDQVHLLSVWIDPEECRRLQLAIPRSIKTVLSMFHLDPFVHRYLVCPQCYALAKPRVRGDGGRVSVNTPLEEEVVCQHRETAASPPCHTRMTRCTIKGKKEIHRPIKEYYHQDMFEWMGRFICRPQIEETLRQRKAEFQARKAKSQEHRDTVHPSPGTVQDFLESPGIEGFAWPDGQSWYQCANNEYRIFFYLSGDGFNPFSNREAKQTATSTGLYLFCGNLPLEERYKPENVYLVGIIPGPDKPSTSQINYYTSLLVDDLLKFWEGGVKYTRTSYCPEGALVRVAGVPVVSDALAARQMSGYSSITSQFFCTFCWLPISLIENFQKSSWPPRDLASHKFWAEQWKDAPDEETRLKNFTAHGIRYTPFLRLPYFNPITFTIVDTMHNLFLGLLQRHCRSIWGMDLSLEDGDGSIVSRKKAPSVPSVQRMNAARRALEFRDWETLGRTRKYVLWYLCLELDLRRGGKKRDLVRELIGWVSISSPCVL